MEEYTDNTTGVCHVLETGDDEEVRTILGDREKIRHTGIIRAGVKVPKNSCTAAEKTKFKQLEAEGLPYDEIDKALGGKPKSKDSKLFPTNVDYFVIRDCDFRRPDDAELIRSKYADPDGHVRRIPIWFTVSDLDKAIPHNFRAFDGNGNVRAYSYYNHNQLMLKYAPKSIKDPKKTDWIEIPFDPDKPPADCHKIDFGGMYRVNVEGIRGLGEIIVPTKSWYGMGDAVAQLKRVRQPNLLGRFDGMFQGKSFLELCKVEEWVKDPDGKRVRQWIITVELAIDPCELARHAETRRERGMVGLSLLNGTPREAHPFAPAAIPGVETAFTAALYPVGQPEPQAGQPEPPQAEQPEEQKEEISVRRRNCLTYLANSAKVLALTEKQIHDFAATSCFGSAVEDLSDDELAKFCENLRATIKNKDAENVKADILAVIGG
jgi:hypothetical protein